MKNNIYILIILALFYVLSANVFANTIILNHNFESDAIPLEAGATDYISGWNKSGSGEIGVYAPFGRGVDYDSVSSQGQVAFLRKGARISQATAWELEEGMEYRLTFDVGQRIDQPLIDFVARLKVDGLILAQLHSNSMGIVQGSWKSGELILTATNDMPIGKPIAIEFQNTSSKEPIQIDIDNLELERKNISKNIQISYSIIDESLILNVPEEYSDINEALRYLEGKIIKNNAIVTIKLNDCGDGQNYYKPITFSHPNGMNIELLGNNSNCPIKFHDSDGFIVENGNVLGSLKNVDIVGDFSNGNTGILVRNRGILKVNGFIYVKGFENGVVASNDSNIINKDGNNYINVGDGSSDYDNYYIVGINAKNRSFINSRGHVSNSKTGFLSESNSVLKMPSVSSYHNVNSLLAINSSSIYMQSPNIYYSEKTSEIQADKNSYFSIDNENGNYDGGKSAYIYSGEGVESSDEKIDLKSSNFSLIEANYIPSASSVVATVNSIIKDK